LAAACVLALAACKKSSTGGMGTGGTGTATGGTTGATGGTTGATGGTTGATGGTTGATGGTTGATGGTTGATGGTTGGTAGSGTAGSSAMGGGKAVANIMPFGSGMAMGTATFTQTGSDVKVDVMLTAGCPMGGAPVHIHQGTSCTDAMTQGGHWDTTPPAPGRGEGIPNITCMGATGTTTATRMPTDPALAWTVGGPMTTNVVGHVIVVHQLSTDGGTPPRIGCGVITMQ
jgi:hypothetical protein